MKIRFYLGLSFLAAMLVYQNGAHGAPGLIKQVFDILVSL